MLDELICAKERIVGTKQIIKALHSDDVAVVYIADDADIQIKEKIMEAIGQADVNLVYVETMDELGRACGIDVGSAAAAIKR